MVILLLANQHLTPMLFTLCQVSKNERSVKHFLFMQALGGPQRHLVGCSLRIPGLAGKLRNIMINFAITHDSITLKVPATCL